MTRVLLKARWQSLKEKLYKEDIAYSNYKNRNKAIFLAVLIFIGGIFYLCQINNLATKGYQIKEHEEKISHLKDANKRLLVEVTELRSFTRLNEKVKELKMVEVARVEYLQANGSTVAMNR